MKLKNKLKQLKKIKPFKKPRNGSNKIWAKIQYNLEKEKLEKLYYAGKLSVEELNRKLKEIKTL